MNRFGHLLGMMDRDATLRETERLLEEGQFQAALNLLRNYLGKYDGDAVAHALAGDALFETQQYALAAREYRHSLAVNGNQPEVGKTLLDCLMKLHRWEEARDLADELHRANPADRVLGVMRESCHENAPLPAIGWEVDVAQD